MTNPEDDTIIISEKINLKGDVMKVGIYGYGNLGKGVEIAVKSSPDAEIFGVFTRRDPSAVKTVYSTTAVYSANDVLKYKDQIDVMIICGGSATDLPVMTPALAEHFNVIDSFDTHADIPRHYANVDKSAKRGEKTAVISVGWDPGMFSLARLYGNAILPQGKDYTFWGKGISQGHSDAIRRIDGVIDARQYTCPNNDAIKAVRSGEAPELTTREKHTRLCYVVAADGADRQRIEEEIKNMPKYFADYDTTVNFISQEELNRDHKGMPHGGFVIRTGTTGESEEHRHIIEYALKLDSNPEFTASVLVAFARAAVKMHSRGCIGCRTVFDIAPADLMPITHDEIIKNML